MAPSTKKKSEALLEEEAIIKKRFLTQTAVATSTGGGAPFTKLVQSFQSFCEAAIDDEERRSKADELLSDVYSIQSYLNKLESMMMVYETEQATYHEKHRDILLGIDRAGQDIKDSKIELEHARREMAQAKECEGIKQNIVRIPAVSATVLEIDAVKQEIAELEQQRLQMKDVTRERINQFRTILDTITRVEMQASCHPHATMDVDDENA
jgi:DNA gyrase/topoisomerase IV subunit A